MIRLMVTVPVSSGFIAIYLNYLLSLFVSVIHVFDYFLDFFVIVLIAAIQLILYS